MDHRQILEKAAGHTPILRVGPPISRSFRSTPRNCHSTPQFDRSLDIASVIFTRMLSFRVFATHHPGLARTTHAHRPLTPRPHFTPLPLPPLTPLLAAHPKNEHPTRMLVLSEHHEPKDLNPSVTPVFTTHPKNSPSKFSHCHTSKMIGLKVLCLPHIREKGGVPPLFPLPAGASWFYLLYLPRSRCAPRAHACPLLRNNSFACHTCAFHGGRGVV
jgi:hypothetical protein